METINNLQVLQVMNLSTVHKPVLLKEVLKVLNPQLGEFFIDGTFGGGGHATAILKKIKPGGRLLGIDWSDKSVNGCNSWRQNQKDNVEIICAKGNFANLPVILMENNLPKADGLLLDLGISSDELESSGRGFSFQKDEPLLMTYNDERTPVKELLRQLDKNQLAEIIKKYGGENWAIKIAQAIKDYLRKKPIATSRQLAEIVTDAVPGNYERGRIHPATRTFMALRIYANEELANLEKILKNASQFLLPKGRLAVISFHSLEDRLVKNYFKNFYQAITKKPIRPARDEVFNNPRSRSAKLRAALFLI